MTFVIDTDNLENDEFQLTESGNDLVLTHKASGQTFTYDDGKGSWVPAGGLDLSGSDITGVNSLDTDKARIETQAVIDVPGDFGTVQEAVDAAYLSGPKGPTKISVDGSTYNESVRINGGGYPDLWIEGATDGGGNPATVIDGGAAGKALEVEDAFVIVDNVKFQNGGDEPVRAYDEGHIVSDNCTFTGGDKRAAIVASGGVWESGPDDIADQSGLGTSFGVSVFGKARLHGTYLGGTSGTVQTKESGGVAFVTGTVTGDGTGTTTSVLKAEDGSSMKVDSGATVEEGSSLVESDHLAFVDWRGPTEGANNNRFNPADGGVIYDVPNDEVWWSMPQSDGDLTGESGGVVQATMYYDKGADLPKWYDGVNYHPFGVKEYSNAGAADLEQLQAAFDGNRGGTGNSAVLFKDSSGTVHYADFDGTL